MTGMLIVSVYLVTTAIAAFILAIIGELDVFEKPAVAIKRVPASQSCAQKRKLS